MKCLLICVAALVFGIASTRYVEADCNGTWADLTAPQQMELTWQCGDWNACQAALQVAPETTPWLGPPGWETSGDCDAGGCKWNAEGPTYEWPIPTFTLPKGWIYSSIAYYVQWTGTVPVCNASAQPPSCPIHTYNYDLTVHATALKLMACE